MLEFISRTLFSLLLPSLNRMQETLDNLVYLVDQINGKVDAMGTKEDAALAKMDELLDHGDEILSAIQDWKGADDEEDATKLLQRAQRLQAQQEAINAEVGLSTTVNPSQPIDAASGANLPQDPGPVPAEDGSV